VLRKTLYCLGCGQLISHERASKTFRTGYYRVIYPLAFCIDCAKKDELKEQELYDPLKLPYSEHSLAGTQTTI
jgi:hypothetical protein